MRRSLLTFFLTCFGFLIISSTHAQTLIQEGFEGTTFPPSGWTRINNNSPGGNDWKLSPAGPFTDGPYTAATGSNCMVYEYSSTSPGDAWMITPVLALTAGSNYIISFSYRVNSSFYTEKLKVTIGSDATVAGQSTTLWDNNGGSGLTNTTYATANVPYTATATGNFYVGFNCYSIADQWALKVDDISVVKLNACTGTPNAGSATSSTNYLCSPGNANLNITGSSIATGLTYQWQSSPAGANTFVNDGPSSSTPNYTVSVSSSTDYRCRVTCTSSGLFANSIPVTVEIGGVPANDDFCSAESLTLDAPFVCGNTTCATAVGDPTFTASLANNTVWYKYTPSSNGPVQMRMKRPTGVTNGLLNAWAGFFTASGSCPSLSFTEIANSALNFDLPTSDSINIITTSLAAGTTYYIMIDGFSGSFGAYCLRITSPPTPPNCVMNVSPMNNAVNRPVDDTLKWRKAPGANITYDIYFGTTTPPTLALSNFADTTIPVNGMAFNTTYNWYVVPKNDGSPATGCEINATSFTTVGPPPAPANDECVNAIALSAYGGSINGTTISSTQSMAPEVCAGFTSTSAHDVWYQFTALQNGDVSIALTNAGPALDAVIQAYSGTCGALVNIGCADANPSAGGNETLVLTGLLSGQTYYIRIYSWTTTTAQGNFRLTTTGTALPVRITQFTGVRNGNVNRLSWTTASEVNNNGFELQRSADGKNFSMLQFVQTQALDGNSSSPITYNYVDERPLAGSGYYRLKQLDKDGKFSYSNIVLIKGDKTDNLDIVNIYPNPTVDRINVVFASPINEKVNIVVTDLAGKLIINQSVQLISGDNNISVDVSKLSAGSYVIKTICSNGCETAVRKFVKQ